ncbi:MAG: IS110 family transposase [Arcicella sp.]|nr:IS110 family transposase [Arcicella sp.]
MKNYAFFVGIDVSKETLDFALIANNVVQFHLQVTNDKRGIDQFIKQAKKQNKTFSFENSLFCMEHTGIYNNPLLNYLPNKHADIWLEQATQIKASMGVSREKNDKIDSQKIGLYAYKNREDVKLWTPKRPVIVQLDRLTALRDRLVKTIKVLKTPLSDAKKLVDKKMLNSETALCKSSMDALKEDLKSVDKKIKELIDQDSILKELFDIVDSVKGIGPVIATEVLITTNEFKDITDPKKYACFSGFAPFEHSSGKYKGKSKVSNKANKKVKALFHNGAMSAIQHCQEIKEYYQRKVSEGKNEMLVINNVCNKLVHRIFACISRREKYNENYTKAFA